MLDVREAQIQEAKRRILALIPDGGFILTRDLFERLDVWEPLLQPELNRSAYWLMVNRHELLRTTAGNRVP